MPTCQNCGTAAREGARFCGVCGQPIATGGSVPAGKGAPIAAGKAQTPGAAPAPPGGPASEATRSPNRKPLLLAVGALGLALILLAVVLVTSSSEEPELDEASSADDIDEADDANDDGDADGSATDEREAPPTPDPPTSVEVLQPDRTTATNTRAGVQRGCGGFLDFRAGYLFDGDANTGWGASDGDGSGESVTMSFDRPVRLVQVGITPGFTRVSPRSDQGCVTPVSAFDYNRFVAEVRWTFGDGSWVDQTFQRNGQLQRTRVDVTTGRVTMTIVRTDRSPIADDDTIISSMELRGAR